MDTAQAVCVRSAEHSPGPLDAFLNRAQQSPAWFWEGKVRAATGQTIESEGPVCSVGDACEIVDQKGRRLPGEVIAFRGNRVISMPLVSAEGVRFGDTVAALGCTPQVQVGDALIGRVLDATGRPLDNAGPLHCRATTPIQSSVPKPLDRVPIRHAIGTGIRAIDGLLTMGRGQRMGIFGGSGVGKSTLIGMMTRNADADVIVVGLVGERGREVAEFLEDSLGEEGRRRSVVLVATSDESPLLRMRAALAATAVAEHFASQGKHVLLVLDSLTRFAMAAREVGLAAGEPPTAKGYTPSVFTKLAKLVERAGQFRHGSITAFYTVLMEGDDQQDPIVDAVRSFVDGHIVLSRALAGENSYPPIAVLDSLSRLMPAVVSREYRTHAAGVRKALAIYAKAEDLIRIGAYKQGMDPALDRAVQLRPAIRSFLEQDAAERLTFADVQRSLFELEA